MHLQKVVGGPEKVKENVFTDYYYFLGKLSGYNKPKYFVIDHERQHYCVVDFEVAMDIGSGIMLPVETEGDKMTVVPKSAKSADESGIIRFGIFFSDRDPAVRTFHNLDTDWSHLLT